MNEAGTRAEHIDPALKAAGWGVIEGSRFGRDYPGKTHLSAQNFHFPISGAAGYAASVVTGQIKP
jgi:hypothetical protein